MHGLKILLIEDDPTDVLLVQEALSALPDHTLLQAETLRHAMDIVQTQAPDVILMDLGLPDGQQMASYSVMRQVAPSVPILILTGLQEEALAMEALRMGAQDYLIKGHFPGMFLARAIRYAIERKRGEEALRESETRYRTLFEQSLQPTWVIEPHSLRILACNTAAIEQYGYSRQEFLSMSLAEIRMAEHVPDRGLWRHRLKNGAQITADCLLADIVFEGRSAHLLVAIDVTAREREQQLLQDLNATLEQQVLERTAALEAKHQELQGLASLLNETAQRERKRLATEMHDNLAQLLVVGRMKLDLLTRDGILSESLQAVKELRQCLSEALNYTRTLISDLRPPVAEGELNLGAGIAWVVKKLQRFGLVVKVTENGCMMPVESEAVVILLLEALHELLFNVLKHAQTKEAFVALSQTDTHLEITVQDHGCGFDLAGERSRPKEGGLGLLSIRERLVPFNAHLHIDSRPRHGTCSTIAVPLDSIRNTS
jgi:two-component system, NarL family, sensor histidine kinase UhpB